MKGKILAYLLLGLIVASCHSGKHTSGSSSVKRKESGSNSQAVSAIKAKYAKILGVPEFELKNEKLYHVIDEWMGVPYKYGGKDKNGIDCSGFSGMIYKTVFGIALPASSNDIYKVSKFVKKYELKEGDLVFFKIDKPTVSHVGVYLANNKFVHATTRKGVMINDLDEPYYANSFFAGGCIK